MAGREFTSVDIARASLRGYQMGLNRARHEFESAIQAARSDAQRQFDDLPAEQDGGDE